MLEVVHMFSTRTHFAAIHVLNCNLLVSVTQSCSFNSGGIGTIISLFDNRFRFSELKDLKLTSSCSVILIADSLSWIFCWGDSECFFKLVILLNTVNYWRWLEAFRFGSVAIVERVSAVAGRGKCLYSAPHRLSGITRRLLNASPILLAASHLLS